MICVEANFPPAPARVRPRMCERTLSRFCHLMAKISPPDKAGNWHISHEADFTIKVFEFD